jgi:hypothetical protein
MVPRRWLIKEEKEEPPNITKKIKKQIENRVLKFRLGGCRK